MKKTPKTEPTEMTTLRLPITTKRAIQKLAVKDNRTFSNYVSLALTNHAREAGALKPQKFEPATT